MTTPQSIIILILLVTIGMFLWGRWRHDIIALAALLACVLSGVLDPAIAFNGFGHPAVVTVACVLVLSAGLQRSGAVDVLARYAMPNNSGLMVSMAALVGVGALLSGFMNNAATAAVMCPIAIGAALSLEVNTDSFLMAVAIGASCAFLTPIGHQNNTLILGPSGFKFGDYWRLGLPLEILVVAVALPLLLVFWPL